MEEKLNLKNRYPGVRPFALEDSTAFYGREADSEKILSMIFVKPLVVLYSKSGYGKSSLINAAVTPKILKEGMWNISDIRFNYFSDKNSDETISPADTLRNVLKDKIDGDKGCPIDELEPNENSFWYWIKAIQHQLKQNNFIFFFDQFEEIFSYPEEEIEEFSELLSQLLYNKIPSQFRKRMMEMEEKGILSEELHNFLHDEPEIKVVFIIRSDRLAEMNTLTDKHQGILHNLYELHPLTVEEAKNAITIPASLPADSIFLNPPFSYTPEALDMIIEATKNPDDEKIENSTLQIVCKHVEDDIVKGRGEKIITPELLGNVTDIFRVYYEGILAHLNPEDRTKSQHLIEDELIDKGHVNPLSFNYIKSKFGLSEELLSKLEKTSLLLKERDSSGRILYEMSHDSLVAAIQKVADGRRLKEEENKNKELQKQAIIEMQRAEKLDGLNKMIVLHSKRAKRNFMIAISFLLLFLFATGLSYYFYTKKTRAEMAATEAKLNEYKMLIHRLNDQFKSFTSQALVFDSAGMEDDAVAMYDSAENVYNMISKLGKITNKDSVLAMYAQNKIFRDSIIDERQLKIQYERNTKQEQGIENSITVRTRSLKDLKNENKAIRRELRRRRMEKIKSIFK